jgi:hypothetical protein
MKSDARAKIVVFLTVLLLIGTLYLQGQSIITRSISAYSWIATTITIILIVWDKWLWRIRLLYPLSKMPDVRGTWKAELNSFWKDPKTGQIRGKVEVYLVFRQSFSSLDIRLFSTESSSVSLSANVVTDGEGVHTIATIYRNEPSLAHLVHSPISHGGMLLSIRGERVVKQIDGKYWTDRQSMGEIKMTERSWKIASGFDEASKLVFNGGQETAIADSK